MWRPSSNTSRRPKFQAAWHQETGYLPITQAAYDLSTEQGYYAANPGADVSILQMTLNEPTDNSRGLRFGNYVQIRTIIDEEFPAPAGRQRRCAGRASTHWWNAANAFDPRLRSRQLSQIDPGPRRASRGAGQLSGGAPPCRPNARSSATRACPTCLLAPQLVITAVFFLWPAGQAVYTSFLREDAFGLSTNFVVVRQLRAAISQRRNTSMPLQVIGGVFHRHGGAVAGSGGCCWPLADRSHDQKRARAHDPVLDLALCGCAPAVAGIFVVVHLHPHHRHPPYVMETLFRPTAGTIR